MAFGLGAKRWAGRNVLLAGAEGRAFWVKVVPKGLGDGVGGAVPIDLYNSYCWISLQSFESWPRSYE